MLDVRHMTVLLSFGEAFQPIQRRRCLEQIDVLSIPLETRAEYARKNGTTRSHQRRAFYEREQETRARNIAVHIIKSKRMKSAKNSPARNQDRQRERVAPAHRNKYRNKTAANKEGRGRIARAQY